jgi:hypothetical protein
MKKLLRQDFFATLRLCVLTKNEDKGETYFFDFDSFITMLFEFSRANLLSDDWSEN